MIGLANLVIWPALYERQRRIICRRHDRRERAHPVRGRSRPHRRQSSDGYLSADLAGVSDRDDGFPLPHGRGDEFPHGNPGIDPRRLPPKVPKPRDNSIPDLEDSRLPLAHRFSITSPAAA
jgi:error-prone DNA polymerase